MSSFLAPPLPFRVLIDEAMKLSRRHARAIYPSVALPVAILIGPLMVGYSGRLARLFGSGSTPSPANMLSELGTIAVWFVLWGLLNGVATSALQAAVMDALAGREVRMKRSWLFVLRPRVLLTMLLVSLCCGAAFFFCILPLLYVIPLLSLVMPVMVDEARFGMAALRRSAALAGYNGRLKFWENPFVKILALFLVGWLLSYAVNTVVQLPIIVAQQIFIMRSVIEGQAPDPGALLSEMVWFQVPSAVLSSLATTAIQLYTGFGLGLLFYDIRRRQEGPDLESALDALGAPALSEAEVEPA